MSSNFYTSSHCKYHLHTRAHLLSSAGRLIDQRYCTPRQLYCLHIWFAGLIQKLGKRLLLKQVPIATATVFFKRFYIKNALCETNPFLVLAACVFVAAKVEETPVHIKSVVSEAKVMFAENHIKSFPAETHKLGEMEFYLLEDLDFHLVVFHPHRALLNITGREPADGGKWPKSRLEEDLEIRKAEAERLKKAGAPAGSGAAGLAGAGRARSSSTASQTGLAPLASPGPPSMASGPGGVTGGEEEGESEEQRVTRLMSRGSGEGLMEMDESVLQMSFFVLNDTYRTDVSLLYPPYIIALSAMYIAMSMNSMNSSSSSNNGGGSGNGSGPGGGASGNSGGPGGSHNAPRTRSSHTTQATSVADAISTNAALGIPPPPGSAGSITGSSVPHAQARTVSHTGMKPSASTAHPNAGPSNTSTGTDPRPLPPLALTFATFLSTFNVSLPVLFACVQDLVALYPIWEGFEPTPMPGAAAAAAAAVSGGTGGSRGILSGTPATAAAAAAQAAATGGPGGGVGAIDPRVGLGITGSIPTQQQSQLLGTAGRNGMQQPQQQQKHQGIPFGPRDAEALVRRMIEERAIDASHPDKAKEREGDTLSNAGSASTSTRSTATGGAGEDVPLSVAAAKKGVVVGKKRKH